MKIFLVLNFLISDLLRYCIINLMTDTVCGSSNYVAPEILEKKLYGKECDYWSLGVVIYFMLSGTFPFDNNDLFENFYNIQNGIFNFNANIWSSVSDQAKDFISRLLVVDPLKRLNAE